VGFTLAFALFAAMDIFVFEHFEKMWGKAISFQVSLWLIVVGAGIASLSFGAGAAVFKFVPRKTSSLVFGVSFAAVVFGASWAGKLLSVSSGSLQVTLAVLMLLGGFAFSGILALFKRGQNGEQSNIAG